METLITFIIFFIGGILVMSVAAFTSFGIETFIAFIAFIVFFSLFQSKMAKRQFEKNNSGKNDTDVAKNKSKTYLKISLGIIIILIGIFYSYTNHHGPIIEDTSYYSEADGFTIDKYDIELVVNKDNLVDVTETVYINFYEYGHHGIYKYIPTWLKYTDKNGDTVSRQSKISNLQAVGYEYTIDDVGRDKKRIKIGSADVTLNTGIYKYIIKYTYNMGDDPFTGFDEFIFHAYGDYWGTEIKNPSIKVTLPEEFSSEVNFFTDKYRQININNSVNYRKEGNTIYASVKDDFKLNKSLTIDIELPEGYFNNLSNTKMIISIIICSILIIISIIITIILYTKWQKHGRDPKKKVETVEFYPPDKLDPAQLAYIYKKETGKKLTISLIISLASKGYISIEEDNNKKIIIHNTNKNALLSIRQMTITKTVLNKEEIKPDLQELYNKINSKYFKDANEITLETSLNESINNKSKINLFIEEANDLIKEKYLKITKDVIVDSKNNFTSDETSKKMSHAERIVFDYIFEDSQNSVVLEENTKFYKSFGEVNKYISTSMESRINNLAAYTEMSKSSTLYILSCLLTAITLYASTFYNNHAYIVFVSVISIILNLTNLVLTLITKSKSNYGVEMQAKINGFKNYLNIAEKDQLEAEVNKNPHYFYDILPYAYVLGVSKKWINKFEKLNIPFPVQENFTTDFDVFDDIVNSVSYPVSSSSSSSGCSSCGGGCSSCGGGCSSCGGGGSW